MIVGVVPLDHSLGPNAAPVKGAKEPSDMSCGKAAQTATWDHGTYPFPVRAGGGFRAAPTQLNSSLLSQRGTSAEVYSVGGRSLLAS